MSRSRFVALALGALSLAGPSGAVDPPRVVWDEMAVEDVHWGGRRVFVRGRLEGAANPHDVRGHVFLGTAPHVAWDDVRELPESDVATRRLVPDGDGAFEASFDPGDLLRRPLVTDWFQVEVVLEDGTSAGSAVLPLAGSPPIDALQQIIASSPGLDPDTFDPARLSAAANALHRLGRDRALAELEKFFEISMPGRLTDARVDNPADVDASDRTVVFLLVRVLFEPPDHETVVELQGRWLPEGASMPVAPRSFPPIAAGFVQRDPLVGPAYAGRYPIAEIDGLPLFVPRMVNGRTGVEQHPRDHLRWARQHAELRAEPLVLPEDPFASADSVVERIEPVHWPDYPSLVRRQVWRAVEHALALPAPARGAISDEQWSALRERARDVGLRWSAQEDRYVRTIF